MSRIVLLLLVLLPAGAIGKPVQIIPSDLEVRLSAAPNSGLLPHQMFQITVSVANHGPEPVKSIALGSSPIFDEFALRFASDDCNMWLAVLDGDEEVSRVYIWLPNRESDLAPGETKSCHINLALSLDAPQVVPFSFSLSSEYIDPDHSNDSATIYLQQAVAPIPSDSWPSRTILASLLIAAAWFAVMRRQPRGTMRP